MSEKKVIVVIVEGPSDENAIGGILKEYFSTDEVQFAVVHGDITSNEFTTVDNVIRKIDELIDGIRTKYGYRWDDFIKVIHIADTDGVFTKGCVMEAEVAEIRDGLQPVPCVSPTAYHRSSDRRDVVSGHRKVGPRKERPYHDTDKQRTEQAVDEKEDVVRLRPEHVAGPGTELV